LKIRTLKERKKERMECMCITESRFLGVRALIGGISEPFREHWRGFRGHLGRTAARKGNSSAKHKCPCEGSLPPPLQLLNNKKKEINTKKKEKRKEKLLES
jgi:hypothetical protein